MLNELYKFIGGINPMILAGIVFVFVLIVAAAMFADRFAPVKYRVSRSSIRGQQTPLHQRTRHPAAWERSQGDNADTDAELVAAFAAEPNLVQLTLKQSGDVDVVMPTKSVWDPSPAAESYVMSCLLELKRLSHHLKSKIDSYPVHFAVVGGDSAFDGLYWREHPERRERIAKLLWTKCKTRIMAFSMRDYPEFCAVWVTDPHMVAERQSGRLRHILKREINKSWDAKTDELLFRGRSTGPALGSDEETARNWRSVPRFRAAHSFAGVPNTDVKVATPLIQQYAAFPLIRQEIERGGVVGKYMSRETQARARYQINIDGNAAAWEAPLWKHLIGSTVFYVDSPFKLIWHRLMRPWEHYVPLSKSCKEGKGILESFRVATSALARDIARKGQATMLLVLTTNVLDHISVASYADGLEKLSLSVTKE
jgi:hypothetical protein